MIFCYLCGKSDETRQEDGNFFKLRSAQSGIIKSILKDSLPEESFPIIENDRLCLACNTVLLHAGYLEQELCVFRNILRRQFTKRCYISDPEEEWLEIDHEALAHFELRENIYYCLECSFQTTLFEQVSIHYKFHCITNDSFKDEEKCVTEIELVNCDELEYNNMIIEEQSLKPAESEHVNSIGYEDNNYKLTESEVEENESETESLSEFGELQSGQKKIIKCSMCDFSSISFWSLQHHISNKHKEQSKEQNNRNQSHSQEESEELIKRSPCDFKTKNSSKINSHIQNVHTEKNYVENELNCDVCQKQFNSYPKLHAHIKTNHRQINVSFCEFCGFRLDASGACDHSQAILKDFPQISCNKCDLGFYQKYLLMEHQFNIHLMCRYCQKTLSSKSYLKLHERKHPKRPLYQCSWCIKAFASKNGLKFHSSVHTGLYNFECDQCNKKFAHKKGLMEHMSVHLNEPRYICPLCGKSFMYDASYRIHRKWHDDPYPAKCKLCPKEFRHPTMLAKHRRVVHEGRTPEYFCQFCERKFSTSSSRRCHEMLHSGNFAFKCNICNRGFSRKNHYAVHMQKKHNDESVLKDKVVCQYKVTVPPEDQNYNNSQDNFDNEHVHIEIEIEKQPGGFEKYFESYIENSTLEFE